MILIFAFIGAVAGWILSDRDGEPALQAAVIGGPAIAGLLFAAGLGWAVDYDPALVADAVLDGISQGAVDMGVDLGEAENPVEPALATEESGEEKAAETPAEDAAEDKAKSENADA